MGNREPRQSGEVLMGLLEEFLRLSLEVNPKVINILDGMDL